MPDLPSGTVTFLFTDIEGSTRLLKQLRDRYADLLAQHQRLLRESFLAHGGREVDTQGDSFFVVFARARDAVLAAAEAQRAFAGSEWPDGAVPKVRMGLHTGEPIVGEDRYVGLGVHRAARIMAAGHGGQVLLSEATAAVLADEELPGVELRPLGEHHLKDLDRPERIYQLELDGLPANFPRLKTLDGQPDEATPFAGREDELAEAATAAVAPRRRRIGSLLAAGVILAAGTATALVFLVGRSGDAEALSAVDANAVGVIDGTSRRLASQVEIGAAPSRVAAGAGAIWVTNGDDGSVSRIDPDEGDLRQVIEVGSDPSGVVVGNRAVWVANGLDGTVSRIDPLENDVVQTIEVGNGPAGIAFGENSVWVANRTDGTATRIDARTGKVRGTFPAGAGATDLAVGDGTVWVASPTEAAIVELDAETGNTVRSTNVGNGPSGVALGSGSVWVTNGLDGTVSRIDPETGSVTATIPVGDSPNDVVVGGDGVWVSNEFGKTVSLIDPTENAVSRTIELGNLPTGLAVAGEKVWVAVRASGNAHRGGKLTLLASEDPSPTMDPALEYDPLKWSALIATNDGLTAFKRVGGSEGGQVVPDLATSLPVPTDGGKTYTFELRPGIRYSTGAPVRARDIRTAIERVFRLESPGRGFYDRIVGADACSSKPAACTLGRGITTDDAARRITFHLTAPDADFLYKLAIPFAFAVPSHSEAGVQPATGPYKVARYKPQQELRLVRNPRFREWSRAAQPDGYPDELVWRFGVSVGKQVDAIQRRRADAAGVEDLPPSRQQELRTQYASQLHAGPEPTTFYVALNTRVPPFDDVRARRALNYAIDREEVVRLSGGPERAQLTCQGFPPNYPGYRRYCPYTVEPNSAGTWTGPDLAAAQRLIATTQTKGSRVTVWWSVFSTREAGSYVVSVLRTLGYRARLRFVDDGERYFRALSDSRRRVQAGVTGWIADYPAEAGFLSVQLTCEAFVPRSVDNQNFAQFCDRKIDAEIARAQVLQTTDPQAASELWAQIDRRIVDRAPWVPLYNTRSADFVSERVGNYQNNPQWGMLVDQLWVR